MCSIAQGEDYQTDHECIIAIFDTRAPGVADRLGREQAGWRQSARIEALDSYHRALVIRPGGALERAA